MANYFNADYYFAAKAKQLSKTSDGKTWTAADVQAEFAKQGINAEDHYKAYGASEGLSPNAYFNEKEYLASKLAALQDNDPTWANKTVADLQAEFKALGINAADHYEQYGAFETRKDGTLLNPSNAFDANAYFAAKLAQLQKIGFEGADTMTVADVVKAVQEAGISPVAHLQAYGATEAKTDGIPLVQTVPVAQRVPNDPIRAQFGELVPSNYNPPSKAPAAAVAAPVTKPADVGGLSATKPVLPTAPVKVPGDTGYIAPPANLVDTNEKPVLPPTTTEGTGPNTGFIVVDPTTGKGTVIDPATGAEKGTVDVVVKDGVVTPPAPNAPVVDKDGNNINDKPADDTGKPVEPTPPTVDPDEGEGDGGGGTTTSFNLAEDSTTEGQWNLTGSGTVVITSKDDDTFTFTGSGTSKDATKVDINDLVVTGVTLSGKPDVLKLLTKVTGSASVTDTVAVAASDLTAIDAIVSGKVVVSGVPSISGTFDQVKAVYDAKANFTGLESKALDLGGSITVANALAADDFTTGVVTATIDPAANLTDLATLKAGNNAFTIVLTAEEGVAANLKKVDAATTVVINGDQLTKISGSAEDVLAVFNGNGFSNIGDLNLDVSGTATTAQAAELFAFSTGDVKVILGATIGTEPLPVQIGDEITLTISANLKLVAQNALTDVGDYYFDAVTKVFSWIETKGQPAKTITLSNGGSVTASGKAITIGAGTFAVTEVDGKLVVGTENGDVTVAVSVSDLLFTATEGTNKTATVTAANLSKPLVVDDSIKLSGEIAALNMLTKIEGSVTLTGTSATLDPAAISTLAAKVEGNVNIGTGINLISGTNEAMKTFVEDTTIIGYGALPLTATGNTTVADANKLDAKTTGVVTAAIDPATTLTDLLKLTKNADGSVNEYTIVVKETSATAEQLLALDALTSEKVVVTDVTTVTGKATELAGLFAAKANFTNLGDEAVTINDDAGTTLAAADLNTLDAATSGLVTVTNKVALTGSGAELSTLYGAKTGGGGSTIAFGDDLAVTVTGSDYSVAQLKVVNDATTGTITLSDKTVALTGGVAADTLLALEGITDYTGNITVTDATITAETLNVLDAANGAGKVSTSAGGSAGAWNITGLNGKTVAATSSVDTFVFTTTETSGVAITDFALADDSVNVSGLTDAGTTNAFTFEWKAGETVPDAKIIAATNDIFKIETEGANDADGTTAAATAINSAVTTWTTTSVTSAYFVIVDSDSTGIFKFVENSTAGIQDTELTLIGTVDGKLTTDNFDFAVIS